MHTHLSKEEKKQNSLSSKSSSPAQFKDNRPETAQLKKMQEAANNSSQVQELTQMKSAANGISAKKGADKEFVPQYDDSAFEKKRQKRSIGIAVKGAYQMITKAKNNVDKDNKLYKRWMDGGKTDPEGADARVSHVRAGIDKISEVLQKEEIFLKQYDLDDGEEDETYAYVDPSEKQHNIYLGGSFWSAPANGANSKAGTIIHELSHRVHGTDDHAYGKPDCKALAKDEPDLATENADNYEFLAENS